MNQDFQKYLAERAYENFTEALPEIDIIKAGIADNRSGRAKLTEIQAHQDRLSRRMERESKESMEVDVMERINGVPNFQDISIIQKIARMSEAVCRITIQSEFGSSGSGSGALIAPNLIITNNHVFPSPESAANSLIQFGYQLDEDGNPMVPSTFRLRPDQFFVTSGYRKNGDPLDGLDYTILAVEDQSLEGNPLAIIPYIQLKSTLGKVLDGENCVIIQHPANDYKKIVLTDIRMLTIKDDVLWYESDTLPGSSGSIVLGLGTGEAVALHHSGVPRKNQNGEILKKDGSLYRSGDADKDIDWMANEGIRISRILNNLEQRELSEEMSALRETIFQNMNARPIDPTNSMTPNLAGMPNNKPSIKETNLGYSPPKITRTKKRLLSFEVLLSNDVWMQNDWQENTTKLVPGLQSAELLFPHSTEKNERRFAYVVVSSDEHPFEIADKLESLPQVDQCTPDLPMDTDSKIGHSTGPVDSYESMNKGVANWHTSERDFQLLWGNAEVTKDFIANKEAAKFRNWSRKAVGLPFEPIEQKSNSKSEKLLSISDQFKAIIKGFEDDLKEIKIVQIDTGYTDHSKTEGGFDLSRDEDFIDGDDARDEMRAGYLRYPGHGTRTASIVVGNASEQTKNNGNLGALSDERKAYCKVIPYRVAESPIVINKGRNVFQAVQEAIYMEADVIFMCMGSYPRPMLDQIAKKAYERGIIFVCAAGNYVETIVAPAVYPGTIAVGAINPDKRPWKDSSYGPEIDICAPGESVYVPFNDDKGNDIMAFGSGTSYATPMVAAAAALWKAKNKKAIEKYSKPWKIVEAFRKNLIKSSRTPGHWDADNYGNGILNIKKLLAQKPPADKSLKEDQYRYQGYKIKNWDLGFRESIGALWKTLVRKITPGPESYGSQFPLTERAKTTLAALKSSDDRVDNYERLIGPIDVHTGEELIQRYFKSYSDQKSKK